MLAGLALLLPVLAAPPGAQAEWQYRTVRECKPVNRNVQRCRPVRKCETKYRYANVRCASCIPPRMQNKRIPYQVCATQEQCRREAVTTQHCRDVQKRVWVRNPERIPDKVQPPQND
jgi:hypothetical protein